jgi:hypothetical protein
MTQTAAPYQLKVDDTVLFAMQLEGLHATLLQLLDSRTDPTDFIVKCVAEAETYFFSMTAGRPIEHLPRLEKSYNIADLLLCVAVMRSSYSAFLSSANFEQVNSRKVDFGFRQRND